MPLPEPQRHGCRQPAGGPNAGHSISVTPVRAILGTPKSHQSRTVPLPQFLATEITAAAAGKHADQLVFTMPGGGVMRLSNWRRSVFLSAAAAPVSATGSAFTTCGTPPRR
jgi:hypothetical protein